MGETLHDLFDLHEVSPKRHHIDGVCMLIKLIMLQNHIRPKKSFYFQLCKTLHDLFDLHEAKDKKTAFYQFVRKDQGD